MFFLDRQTSFQDGLGHTSEKALFVIKEEKLAHTKFTQQIISLYYTHKVQIEKLTLIDPQIY